MCATACMLWIAAKIGRKANRPRLGADFSRSFLDRRNEDKRNEAIMLRAHQLNQKHYANQSGDLTDVEKELKLEKAPSKTISDTAAGMDTFPDKLAHVIKHLRYCQAAAFDLQVTKDGTTGGHMVAAYKSPAGSIHFFDPNAGVYEIDSSNVSEFMRGLERAFGNRGWENVEPFHRQHLQPRHNWAQIYSRHPDEPIANEPMQTST